MCCVIVLQVLSQSVSHLILVTTDRNFPRPHSGQVPLKPLLNYTCPPWPIKTWTNTNMVSGSSRHIHWMTLAPLNMPTWENSRLSKNLLYVPANTWRQSSCLLASVGGEESLISPSEQTQKSFTGINLPLLWFVIFHCPDPTETPSPSSLFPRSPFKEPSHLCTNESWVSPWALFSIAIVYYWLKSILSTLTGVWLCKQRPDFDTTLWDVLALFPFFRRETWTTTILSLVENIPEKKNSM